MDFLKLCLLASYFISSKARTTVCCYDNQCYRDNNVACKLGFPGAALLDSTAENPCEGNPCAEGTSLSYCEGTCISYFGPSHRSLTIDDFGGLACREISSSACSQLASDQSINTAYCYNSSCSESINTEHVEGRSCSRRQWLDTVTSDEKGDAHFHQVGINAVWPCCYLLDKAASCIEVSLLECQGKYNGTSSLSWTAGGVPTPNNCSQVNCSSTGSCFSLSDQFCAATTVLQCPTTILDTPSLRGGWLNSSCPDASSLPQLPLLTFYADELCQDSIYELPYPMRLIFDFISPPADLNLSLCGAPVLPYAPMLQFQSFPFSLAAFQCRKLTYQDLSEFGFTWTTFSATTSWALPTDCSSLLLNGKNVSSYRFSKPAWFLGTLISAGFSVAALLLICLLSAWRFVKLQRANQPTARLFLCCAFCAIVSAVRVCGVLAGVFFEPFNSIVYQLPLGLTLAVGFGFSQSSLVVLLVALLVQLAKERHSYTNTHYKSRMWTATRAVLPLVLTVLLWTSYAISSRFAWAEEESSSTYLTVLALVLTLLAFSPVFVEAYSMYQVAHYTMRFLPFRLMTSQIFWLSFALLSVLAEQTTAIFFGSRYALSPVSVSGPLLFWINFAIVPILSWFLLLYWPTVNKSRELSALIAPEP